VLKPFFKNKTDNCFVETGYLLVIGLRDVMCHMAAVLKGRQPANVVNVWLTQGAFLITWEQLANWDQLTTSPAQQYAPRTHTTVLAWLT